MFNITRLDPDPLHSRHAAILLQPGRRAAALADALRRGIFADRASQQRGRCDWR
jgi:hypothetical protein